MTSSMTLPRKISQQDVSCTQTGGLVRCLQNPCRLVLCDRQRQPAVYRVDPYAVDVRKEAFAAMARSFRKWVFTGIYGVSSSTRSQDRSLRTSAGLCTCTPVISVIPVLCIWSYEYHKGISFGYYLLSSRICAIQEKRCAQK